MLYFHILSFKEHTVSEEPQKLWHFRLINSALISYGVLDLEGEATPSELEKVVIPHICAIFQHSIIEVLRMGIQEALEFFEIPKGWHQTLENVRGKTFAVDALY